MCHNNCVYTKKYITNHRNVLLISFIQFQLIINCRQRDLNPRKDPQTLINQGFAASGNQKVIKKVIKEKEKESYRIYLRITILKTRCHYKKVRMVL